MHNVKPVHGPARVALVSIGPRAANRWFVVRPQAIADLPCVPVVAVDFYPGRPTQACKPQEPKCP